MPNHYDDIAQLYVELLGTDPIIWRRVQVPADLRLHRVHDIVQAVFDWTWSHLYFFVLGDWERIYGPRELTGTEIWGRRFATDRNVKLGDLLSRGVGEFGYLYDLGDEWQHWITVETVFAPDPAVEYPVYVAGEKAGPPEDCGGPEGFAAIMDVLEGKDHPDRDEILEFYGRFDPDDIFLERVEAMLSRIRRSRRGGPPKGSPQRGTGG